MPDLLIVSPAMTGGWATVEEELSASLERIGRDHRVARVQLGPSARLRRVWPAIDAVEARGARAALERGLREAEPAAVLFLSTTALLAAPLERLRKRRITVLARIDTPAAVNRRGPTNAVQRWLERRRLPSVDLVLAMGPRSAESLGKLVAGERVAIVPNPIRVEPSGDPPDEPPRLLAYAGNPLKKGLDTIVRAWSLLEFARGEAELAIAGLDSAAGEAFLREHGLSADIEWHGRVPREEYLELLRGSTGFLSASRIEEHGLAQLEAIAAGVPLVTTASPGAYEAEPIARELAPQLVAPEATPEALASAISALLAMSREERRAYAAAAQDAVRHLRPPAADRALEEALRSLNVPRTPL